MALKRNVIANYLGAGWTALITFAFVPLYIRYLGIESYGLIGIYTMLQAWLSLLDLGLTPALGRELAGLETAPADATAARDLLRSVEVVVAVVGSAVALVIWRASPWLATHWLSSRSLPVGVVAQAIALMGVVIALRFAENIYRGSIVGLQRQVVLNIVTGATATLRATGAVAVLVLVSPTIQAYFAWQCVASVLGVAALAVTAHRTLPPAPRAARFSIASLRSIARFAAGTMTITLLALMLTQVDKLLLSRLLTLDVFGYYAFAVVVAQMPVALVGPVTQAFYPRFAADIKQGGTPELAHAYHAACQLVTVLLGPACVLLLLFGRDVLNVWTGDPGLSAKVYPLVSVLVVGSLLNGLMTPPYFLQLASGWTGLMIRVNLVAIAVVIPALFWIVPRYGTMGAAWVWMGLNLVCVVVIIPLMHRRLLRGEALQWVGRDVAMPLGMALLAAMLVRWLLPDDPGRIASLARIAVCITLIAGAALFSAPRIRAPLVAHLRR